MKFKAFTNVEEMVTEKILIKKVCKKESKMKIKNIINQNKILIETKRLQWIQMLKIQ